MLMNIRLAFQNQKSVRLLDEVVYNYVPLPSGCMSNFLESQGYEANYHFFLLASIPTEKQKDFCSGHGRPCSRSQVQRRV